ncbi:MAG: hypothetical protein Q9215_003780 [Flavoplaca cf. flavocitrina]
MESNILLNEDPFRNEQAQRLFEAIDELRSCGADTDIGSLPELVIVGDQSAGKSSLLQSLTDIPFPVASRLCTRFPTRIVSRRTPKNDEVFKISLEPGPFDSFGAFAMEENADEEAARLEAYRAFGSSGSKMTLDDFKANVDEVGMTESSMTSKLTQQYLQAQELMSIKHTITTDDGARTVGKRNFSRDVLKVEVSGPNRSYFSILDVPGVFQSLTKDLTSDEKTGVRDMVARYMQPSQSIIICVASGTNDLANQAAFDMASTHDRALKRTVGVITKCDITQDKNQNQEKHLNHGWFVVRNRNPEEIENNISSEERQKREREFFECDPWTELPKSRRGVQALKKYLADLLCNRIQEIFPTILETIKHQQMATSTELIELGPARKTTKEKTTYLTAIAQHLHSLASQAIRGRYHGLTNSALKIRKHIREANEAFATKMRVEGHCVEFRNAPIRLADRKRDNHFKDRHDLGEALEKPKNKVGGQAPSTKGPNFRAPNYNTSHFVVDGEPLSYQHLYVFEPCQHFSPEEIRLSDYLQEQSKPIGSNQSAFGANAQIESSIFKNSFAGSGLFTNNTTNGGLFSQPASSATPTPRSNQSKSNDASVGGLFGQASISVTPAKHSGQSQLSSATEPDERSSPIYTWIREEVNSNRGIELQGTLNPDVLPALFHRQIAKWKDLATSHFSKSTKTVGIALKKAIELACKGDDVVAQRIRAQVRQAENAAEASGLLQIRQRVDEITSRHLQTQNPIFEEEIRKARLARFTAALERYRSMTQHPTHQNGDTTDEDTTDEEVVIDLRNVTALFDQIHMSSAQNLEDDIHDILKSYYDLALGHFIEYVNQHVVESYLGDPEGPVLFFNPTYVSELSQQSVEELGAEDADVVAKRKGLQETLERLNRAEEIALKCT